MAESLLERVRTALADRYAIDREVGHGGMAHVFLAEDLKHHRSVAIKVLRPELAAALGAERFLREIEIAARLNHPHILPLHDSGEAGGILYYVMPYVEGESVRDRLNREPQLPVDEAIHIAQQVASALSYAHRHDVVHRDIKPENILLAGDEVMVADFGIARAITAAGGEQLTSTGIAVGTPAYMSPEQGAGESHIDGRSDIYSLGCVLFEMLAGTPPFVGPNAQAVLARHSMDPVPPLRTVRTAVPEPVERAIVKAMGKVRADRFVTATQFTEALSAAGRQPRQWWWASTKPLRTALAAIAVVGVVAALATRIARARRPAVTPSASVLAVLPFAPIIPDTALSRLGRDLMVTVSATLDQVGELRTVDRYRILTAVDRSAPYSLERAAALSRQFGAGSFVLGSLVRDGDGVRLDIGTYRSDTHAPLGPAIVVRGAPDSLSAFSDSVTWSLLRQIWQRGDPPTPSLEAVTTHSIWALRAFLDGERAVVEDRWPEAEQAFARAVATDSTFWLAYWRYAYTKSWQLHEPDSAALSQAVAHLDQLPERERLLIQVWRAPNPRAFVDAQALTDRFPDFWPGWFERADHLLHAGGLFGHPLGEAREAFERTLDLNPRLRSIWGHLAVVAYLQRDTALLRRAIHERGPSWLFDVYDRMSLDLLEGKPFAGPRADSCVVVARSLRDPFLQDVSAIWFVGLPRGIQIQLSRRVLEGVVLPRAAEAQRLGMAVAWADRGAWDSALTAIDQYATHSPDTTAPFRAYRFAVVGSWLGGLSPEAALQRRKAVRPGAGSIVTWLDGILAAAQRDSTSLRQARTRLSAGDSAFARSLAAFGMALGGRRRQAAESLLAMASTGADLVGPIFTGVNRLAAARWLAAEGESDEAARLLLWRYAAVPDPRYGMGVWSLDVVTSFEAGQIEAARGNVALARTYYEDFLRRFDMPVPGLRHFVTEARAALAGLERPAP